MTGFLFLVLHKRSGTSSLHVTYAVVEETIEACEKLLMQEMSHGDEVRHMRELSDKELAKLGLHRGQIRSIWPTVEL